jgi:hypothetical protein
VVDFQTVRPISGAVVGFARTLDNSGKPVGVTQTALTDADGQYSLAEPLVRTRDDSFYIVVNNRPVGRGYPLGANNRAGDVAVHTGLCATRYGMILDGQTFRPIVGAQVKNLSGQVIATADRDGWYQFDFGCATGPPGFVLSGTWWVTAIHPDYNSRDFAGGRGPLQGVFREDVTLIRR